MNRELLVLQVVNKFGWTKPFAKEYVMERTYNGLSHQRAFDVAMKSTWIPEKFKPKKGWE